MKACLFLKGLKEDDHPHGKYTAPNIYVKFSPHADTTPIYPSFSTNEITLRPSDALICELFPLI